MRHLPTFRQRLASVLRLALGVPSLTELAQLRRELAEMRGLLMAFAAYHDLLFGAAYDGAAYDGAKVDASFKHLLATCRAWLSAGTLLEQEAADEVVRRGRAGRAALDEALRRLWGCS